MRTRLHFALSLSLTAAAPAFALADDSKPAAALAQSPEARFEAQVRAYYADYAKRSPSNATDLGIHDYDGDLEDFSPKGIARARKSETDAARAFEALTGALPKAAQIDLTLVKLGIRARLLELDKVQGWRRYADFYPNLASNAIYVLIERNFAPEEARLAKVIEREKKIPALLTQGKFNLAGVSKVSVEILRQQLPGILDFFATDVPRAFPHALANSSDGKNARLKADFEKANQGVIAALKAYGEFIDKKIAPRAKDDFAIGDALYKEKLAADEMIDTPIDQLLAEGEGEVRRLQGQFKETAAKLDPKMTPAQVQKVVTSDYPPPDKLIASVQARLAGLRHFLADKQIVTVPSEVMPRVEETPPFMRAITLASMFTPGPFETRATDAMYNVTLPEKDWSKEKVDDFMRGAFNRPLMDVVSIHEAYPGHYVQFLWMPKIQSTVRKYEHINSNSEGWAHYCEQMMLDEGWGNGDAKLRLAQLQDALLRAARYVVGIRMHTRGMTLAQASAYFESEGYQSHEVAEVEARRGTEDPTYLYYTWGKLRILELREAYKKKLGADYSLLKFHDALLGQGAIPLPLLRSALLD